MEDGFEAGAVDVVEVGEAVAVDVEDADDGAVLKHRNDNLGAGEAAAGDVAGEGIDIGDDEGAGFGPCGAADTAAALDAGAGDGALEGTQVEPVGVVDEIEADPEEAKGVVQGGGGVGQGGCPVVLAVDEDGVLRQELFVALALRESRGEGECGFHDECRLANDE